MTTMKAMMFKSQNAPLELVHVPIPVPKEDEIRIRILCCGICKGDEVAQHGGMGNTWPRTPGHEVAGIVDELGSHVSNFKKGDYVGIGWFGGSCNVCYDCRQGNVYHCSQKTGACGIHFDGGYAEFLVAKWNAFVRIPKEIPPEKAAPLLCAGLTTFTALRNCGALGGELVVVHGIGGLGHLGVQYARKLGFHVVAVSRGKDKGELAKKLGAHIYLDTETQDAVQEIKALGGARIILETSPDAASFEKIIPALGRDGKMILVGAILKPVSLHTIRMIESRQSVLVWPAGSVFDSEATQKFSVIQDVYPMVEIFPLEKAREAYEHMMNNKGRFRVVLKVSDLVPV